MQIYLSARDVAPRQQLVWATRQRAERRWPRSRTARRLVTGALALGVGALAFYTLRELRAGATVRPDVLHRSGARAEAAGGVGWDRPASRSRSAARGARVRCEKAGSATGCCAFAS
jgi:hypothetical protein